MSTLVSIVIPTYNRAALVQRAIDSALQQTYPDIELIVVDDGSTDGTEAAIRARYGADPRVRYFHQENRGVAGARNRALTDARGDFVAFLDSDDVWRPWKLELQLACMRSFPEIGMLWTDMRAIASDGKVVADTYLRTMYRAWRRFDVGHLFTEAYALSDVAPGVKQAAGRTIHTGDIFSPMVLGSLVHTSTVLLRRDRMDIVGWFDEQLSRAGEDYDFHLRTCREGPVGFADLPTIDYQTGMPDQLTRNTDALAVNFVKTMERTLRNDRERIALPRRIIVTVRSEAQAWAAETLIECGRRHEAMAYLRASLLLRPWHRRPWLQLLLCLLPRTLDRSARRVYHELKNRVMPGFHVRRRCEPGQR